LCNATGMQVDANRNYTITFDVTAPWSDGRRATTPAGASAFEIGVAGPFGVPLRRVVSARYLQPLAEVRHGDVVEIYALEPELIEGGERYRATFRSRQAGELFLFSNDVVLPLPSDRGLRYFYTGERGHNAGTACVTIQAEGVIDLPNPPARSLCAKVLVRPPPTAPATATGPPD